jgi:hypothetical protein
MTVSELIEQLSKLPKDATVFTDLEWYREPITDVHHDALDNEVILG